MNRERCPARTFLLLLVILISSCDNQAPDTNAARKISWFDGSVSEGFAYAAMENKPVYLYWGAEWCPPCQEIKQTVFKSREFIAQTDLFVALYLDGDTAEAQTWGDKFAVRGYPTMIVFDPDGEEVTRIPGGIDISRYNTVLALSLNSMRPTSELVKLAQEDPGKLRNADFTQLAYYSWHQDAGALPEATPASFFYDLSKAAPDAESAARLFMMYLYELARRSEDPDLASSNVPEAYATLQQILDDDALILSCWDSLAYYAADIAGLPVFSDSQRAALVRSWSDRVFALRQDPSLSAAEQLAGWLPLLELRELAKAGPPDEQLIAKLRLELVAAEQNTSNSFARQSVINQLNHVYQAAGLYEDAQTLLLAALEKASSPYYFMSSLAGLAEKEGDIENALRWRLRAYEASSGSATRFQWGASYIRTLLRLTPADHALIASTSLALFDELENDTQALAGRNFRILRSLNRQLHEWSETEQEPDLAAEFHARIRSLCAPQGTYTDEQQQNCLSLLEPTPT